MSGCVFCVFLLWNIHKNSLNIVNNISLPGLKKCIYLFSFRRHFYPKRLTNEDIIEAIKTNKQQHASAMTSPVSLTQYT